MSTSVGVDWNLDAIWIDSTLDISTEVYYEGHLFSGLAFKYQPQPLDLQKACDLIQLTSGVATTSGVGTGQAADVEKIKRIREYLGYFPLATASGVSAQNVNNYKDLADYLLVASSITDHNEMIVSDKLQELVDKLG